jgi:formamidopyrimidine-DNA glycosylase
MHGRTIGKLKIHDARLVQPYVPADVERAVRGQTVTVLKRRGKYLLIELESGLTAVHHLRMTGSFSTGNSTDKAKDIPSHVRAEYTMDDGTVVRYRDPRRFGTLQLFDDEELAAYLDARLGPEPFEESLSVGELKKKLAKRSTSIKAVLLDQRVIAGLGNIYVDEALFQSGIRPDVTASTIGRARLERLRDAIIDRIDVAIAAQGSSLRDYRTVEGSEGGMQERFLVYGKSGQPCSVCGTMLVGTRIAGRGTTYCKRCQR